MMLKRRAYSAVTTGTISALRGSTAYQPPGQPGSGIGFPRAIRAQMPRLAAWISVKAIFWAVERPRGVLVTDVPEN